MFDDRRVARRQTLEAGLEDQDLDAVMEDMGHVTTAMRGEDSAQVIDTEIPNTLREISDDYQDAQSEQSKRIIVADMVESVNNTCKSLYDAALKKPAVRNFKKGFDTEKDKDVYEQVGKQAGKVANQIRLVLALTAMGTETLSNKYPKAFGWMKKLPFIGQPNAPDT